jgi:hypothetical protein
MVTSSPADRADIVRDLSALWAGVSRQHLAGQGCGCGFGGLILQASDFELDIVEFLLYDAAKAGAAHVPRFVTAAAQRGADRTSLQALLRAIETTEDADLIGSGDLDFVIDRLRTTLSSIAEAHRKSRFSCA